jgi:hypothetical protein
MKTVTNCINCGRLVSLKNTVCKNCGTDNFITNTNREGDIQNNTSINYHIILLTENAQQLLEVSYELIDVIRKLHSTLGYADSDEVEKVRETTHNVKPYTKYIQTVSSELQYILDKCNEYMMDIYLDMGFDALPKDQVMTQELLLSRLLDMIDAVFGRLLDVSISEVAGIVNKLPEVPKYTTHLPSTVQYYKKMTSLLSAVRDFISEHN